MEIKNCIEFVSVRNGREYVLHMPAGAPLGEIYDVTFEILNEVVRRAQEAASKAAPQEPAEDN